VGAGLGGAAGAGVGPAAVSSSWALSGLMKLEMKRRAQALWA
jgi:hypothetical protein